jgi:hypothetical protein
MMYRVSLSGSRFIPHLGLQNVIGVWDFSRAPVAQLQLRDPESDPYIPKEVALPTGITGDVDVAISEDVIVICEASLFLVLRFSQFTLITASFFFSPSPPRIECIFSFSKVLSYGRTIRRTGARQLGQRTAHWPRRAVTFE